jgi:hypothetical protein
MASRRFPRRIANQVGCGTNIAIRYNGWMARADVNWPSLSSGLWPDTHATLHMWAQMVGKVRLALGHPVNHWWGVALYPTARGLTTSPIPYAGGQFEIAFDFVDHRLTIDTSDGDRRTIALAPRAVADFFETFKRALDDLRIRAHIWPMPVEVPGAIRFDEDRIHSAYDADAAHQWWRALLQCAEVLEQFRGRFIGKCSPVHFWWGGFDLAVTRFSGRRAPERPGADAVTREGYSHEVISAGFWPGSGAVPEAAFYAYAAPEPAGFKDARVEPAAAFYSADFNEFILRYEDVRRAPSPRDALLQFLQSTYDAGAALGNWNRAELELGARADGKAL